jgi:hypothetical protein
MLFYIARVCVFVFGSVYIRQMEAASASSRKEILSFLGLGYRAKIKLHPSLIRKPFTSKTDKENAGGCTSGP